MTFVPNYADDVLYPASVRDFNTAGTELFTVLPITPVEQWSTLLLHGRVFSFTTAAGAGPTILFEVTWYDEYTPTFTVSYTEQYGVTYRGSSPTVYDSPLYIPIRGRYVSVNLRVVKTTQTCTIAFAADVSRRELIPQATMNHYGMLFGTDAGGAVFTPGGVGVSQTFFANYMYSGLVKVTGFVTQAAGANNLLIIGDYNSSLAFRRKYVLQRTNALLVQEINFVMPYDGHEGLLQFTNFAIPAGTDWELYVYPYSGFLTR